MCACLLSHFGPVQFFATVWTVAHQAPLSLGFPTQEHWSGLPFPSAGHLPDPGIKPLSLKSLALSGGFFSTSANRKALIGITECKSSFPLYNWASQVALVVKNPPANVGDIRVVALIPGSGSSSGGGHGNPLQYSCLKNPVDRGVWLATVPRVTESDMTNVTKHTHTITAKNYPGNES